MLDGAPGQVQRLCIDFSDMEKILKEENKDPEKEILRGILQIWRQVIISALFNEHKHNLSLMERGQRSASGISVDLKGGVCCWRRAGKLVDSWMRDAGSDVAPKKKYS